MEIIELPISTSVLIGFTLVFISGIVITIYLWVSGDKKYQDIKKDLDNFDKISFINVIIDALVLIYLFRVILMFLSGIFSKFYIPSLIGLIFALVPGIIVLLSKYKNRLISKV